MENQTALITDFCFHAWRIIKEPAQRRM